MKTTRGGECELCACSKPHCQSTQPCVCIAGGSDSLEASEGSRFKIWSGSIVEIPLWQAGWRSGWLTYGTYYARRATCWTRSRDVHTINSCYMAPRLHVLAAAMSNVICVET